MAGWLDVRFLVAGLTADRESSVVSLPLNPPPSRIAGGGLVYFVGGFRPFACGSVENRILGELLSRTSTFCPLPGKHSSVIRGQVVAKPQPGGRSPAFFSWQPKQAAHLAERSSTRPQIKSNKCVVVVRNYPLRVAPRTEGSLDGDERVTLFPGRGTG